MDELSVELRPAPQDFADDLEAVVCVNGRSLIALADEAERPFAHRDGKPEMAGSYCGLPAGAIGVLLGEPQPETALYYDDGCITLLSCECGEPGCWPLTVRLDVAKDTITWSEFAQPHRPTWDLSALGPFVFERAQYEAALRCGRRDSNPQER